jgi:hypothetical protein
MMECLQQKRAAVPAAAKAPANDSGAVSTNEDIEIGKPLELKKKPRAGFEL